MSRIAQNEVNKMKLIAVLTMLFLPATFVAVGFPSSDSHLLGGSLTEDRTVDLHVHGAVQLAPKSRRGDHVTVLVGLLCRNWRTHHHCVSRVFLPPAARSCLVPQRAEIGP